MIISSFSMKHCVPRSGAASWDRVFLRKSDKSFHFKGSFKFSNGKQCPKRRRCLLGHCSAPENVTKAFTPKVLSSYCNGKLCPRGGAAASWDCVSHSENLTKSFSLKVPSSLSCGKLCPKRRRLLGHSSPLEILTKAFTLKVLSSFSN